jgi:hypothetical protein
LQLCPLIPDGVEQSLKIKLHSYRFNNKLFHMFLEKPLFVPAARLGPFGNYGTHTLVNFEPALLNEMLNSFVRGVGVDFESGCQRSNGGEGLAGLELAADEGLLSGENYLIDNRLTRLELETQSCHTNNVMHRTENVKKKARHVGLWQFAEQMSLNGPRSNDRQFDSSSSK